MIYVYGNSHANIFTGKPAGFEGLSESGNFKAFVKRPMSAKTFLEDHLANLLVFLSDFNKETDYFLITAGEHDCRVESDGSTKEIGILYHINPFFDQVILNLQMEGYRPIGYGSNPSVNIALSLAWDRCMRQECKYSNIPFLSLMDTVLLPDATLNRIYYQDEVHLSPAILPIIIEKLNLIL